MHDDQVNCVRLFIAEISLVGRLEPGQDPSASSSSEVVIMAAAETKSQNMSNTATASAATSSPSSSSPPNSRLLQIPPSASSSSWDGEIFLLKCTDLSMISLLLSSAPRR